MARSGASACTNDRFCYSREVSPETAEGPTTKITFDTQVWNRMVFPERYSDRPNYAALVKIHNAIRSGQVRGFLSESFGTIESIKREDRARFHLQDVPKVEVTHKSHGPGLHCLTIDIQARHSLHPGLSQEFEEELNEALAMGMKLLSAPYIGMAIPDRLRNNPQIYAEEVFATADYNERFGSVATAIAARGVGGGALAALAKELTAKLDGPRPPGWPEREFLYRVYEVARTSNLKREKEQIEKVFAESADGDLVAAHVAFGNDYLCSDDRGRSALGRSIFDEDNRAWLRTAYGVDILSAQQLADLL